MKWKPFPFNFDARARQGENPRWVRSIDMTLRDIHIGLKIGLKLATLATLALKSLDMFNL